MISNANSGHPGGCLSIAEIMACLYFNVMKIRPREPDWPDRDRFILSKGHAAPVLYAALTRRGCFPLNELKKLRKFGSFLHGHPDIETPGVDMTSGCLGQGISAAAGMALAGKHDNKGYRVFVVIGCGEMNEGQIWEAAQFTAHYRLNKVTVIVDFNKMQFDGPVEQVNAPGDVHKRWESLNWSVIDINGHDIDKILDALNKADQQKYQPTVIIANTIKGRGVNFMEDEYLWHSLMDKELLKDFVEKMKDELLNEKDSFYAQRIW
jgi:transketolase